MNLFFVHTPFQILTAQSLIHVKGLKNNFLVLGYSGKAGSHFLDDYNTLIIENFWVEKFLLNNITAGIFNIKKPFKSFKKLKKINRTIKSLIKLWDIESLYFGDINHISYILFARTFGEKRKIFFFEEGLSHYVNFTLTQKYSRSLKIILKKLVYGFVYRLAGFCSIDDILFSTKESQFGFEIEKKFNIIPIVNNTFEEIIPFKLLVSNRLESRLKKETEKVAQYSNHKKILFLTTSTLIMTENPIEDECFFIQLILNKWEKEKIVVLLKFHPKDHLIKIDGIKAFLDSKKVPYVILFENSSYPTEAFFQYIKIDEIISYLSSSQFYAKIILPKVPVYYLLPKLIEFYNHKGIDTKRMQKNWDLYKEFFMEAFNQQPFSIQ